MPKTNEEFRDLMRKVMAGSDAAAEELFRDYGQYLVHAIRRRLSKRIRSKFDSGDFAQDVWASFFAQGPERRVFRSPEELVKFLTSLARNKVIDAVRHRLGTEKRDVTRERSLDDSQRFDKEHLAADQPTPSQVLMSQEEWTEFLRKQPLVYRRVFILLRAGKTQQAIAQETGLSKRTISRIIAGATPNG